jgi:hypothetical protein
MHSCLKNVSKAMIHLNHSSQCPAKGSESFLLFALLPAAGVLLTLCSFEECLVSSEQFLAPHENEVTAGCL